jgi:Protein of unknown function (DUF3489)
VVDLNGREDQTMTNKLTDAQVALLRSGLQRADQCVVAPTGKGPGAKKSAARMVEAGWLKEIKAKAGAPVWRTDEDIGATYSLKLTAAGLKVVAVNDVQGSNGDPADPTPSAPGSSAKVQESLPARPNFRQGSKLASVMTLLGREDGVTIDELSAAMNWLPHSTRAVLTGLRKRGVLLARRKTPEKRASVYVIEADRVGANGQG